MNWFRRAIKLAAPIAPDPKTQTPERSMTPEEKAMPVTDDDFAINNPDFDINQIIPNSQPQKPQEPTDIADIVGDDFLKGRNISPMDFPAPDPKTKMAGITGHYRHKAFFDAFAKLPKDVKNLARDSFGKMVVNPNSVSLKPINASKRSKYPVFSAKIGYQYRALAVKVGGSFVWFWIGPHGEYDRRSELAPPEVTIPQQQPAQRMHA